MQRNRTFDGCDPKVPSLPLHRLPHALPITAGSSSMANVTVRSNPCGPVIRTRIPLLNGSAAIHASCGSEGAPGVGGRVNLFPDATRMLRMTRADLTEAVYQATGLPLKESDVVVCAIFDSIVRALRSDDKVEIRGFGCFHPRLRQGRVGRNPKTGAKVEVPPKRIPFFKPGKELRDLVDGGHTDTAQGRAINVSSHNAWSSD